MMKLKLSKTNRMAKKTPLETKVVKREVILEATRKDKEFQLVRVVLNKTWKRYGRWSIFESTYSTTSHGFEFRWRNRGSEKWGRSQIWTDKGNEVGQSKAFRVFFDALEYSENMTFQELPEREEYKEEQ
jgi:hypothetical protein